MTQHYIPEDLKLPTHFEISHSTPFYYSNVMLLRHNHHSEGTTFLKPSGNSNPVTEHHIPQGMNPQQHCCGNLKSHISKHSLWNFKYCTSMIWMFTYWKFKPVIHLLNNSQSDPCRQAKHPLNFICIIINITVNAL